MMRRYRLGLMTTDEEHKNFQDFQEASGIYRNENRYNSDERRVGSLGHEYGPGPANDDGDAPQKFDEYTDFPKNAIETDKIIDTFYPELIVKAWNKFFKVRMTGLEVPNNPEVLTFEFLHGQEYKLGRQPWEDEGQLEARADDLQRRGVDYFIFKMYAQPVPADPQQRVKRFHM